MNPAPTIDPVNTVLNNIPNDIKSNILNAAIDKIKYFNGKRKIKDTFYNYLDRSYDRLSVMKTLLYRNEPVRLHEFYVRSSLSIKKNDSVINIDDNKLSSFVLDKKRAVISGSAGLGKSILCKSLFLEMIDNCHEIYPIFIELRELKNHSNLSLIEYICEEISSSKNSITEKNLEDLIERGNILLILDGFDEIDFDIRDRYTKDILKLSKKYKNINIIISSRPDECFSSWSGFYVLTMNELSKDKAVELVRKLNYDIELKNKFIQKINDELYKTHPSFIGNPLLLTMMLLTFQEFAEIPKKIHLFYEQAFQTLFLKHDALKESYKRKSKSGLDINEFKQVLSYFCIKTHVDKKIIFRENDAIKILNQAINHFNINEHGVNAENILYDLMNNLCLIHRDGLHLTFTHRSFQEYFTAIYIKDSSHNDENKLYQIIDKVVLSNQNNICLMLYDMNPSFLERVWIKPKIKKLLSNKDTSDIKQKEDDVNRVVSSIIYSSDKDGTIIYFPSLKNEIDGYDYVLFNKILDDNYTSCIRFEQDEVISILSYHYYRPMKKMSDVTEELKNIGYLECLIPLSQIKLKLPNNLYYKLIDFIYNDLFLNKKKALRKINDYLDRKIVQNDYDLDSLLNS